MCIRDRTTRDTTAARPAARFRSRRKVNVEEHSPLPTAMIPILTTEHFTLQSARGVIMAEIGSRATIYLSAVSASMVALAFVTTLADAEELIRGFVLVVLPVLAFMGFVTKARLVQLSYTDFHYQRAINRANRSSTSFRARMAMGAARWRRSLASVSYTHLDVYKRQVCRSAEGWPASVR